MGVGGGGGQGGRGERQIDYIMSNFSPLSYTVECLIFARTLFREFLKAPCIQQKKNSPNIILAYQNRMPYVTLAKFKGRER